VLSGLAKIGRTGMKEMNDMKKMIGNKEEEKHEEDKLRHEKIN